RLSTFRVLEGRSRHRLMAVLPRCHAQLAGAPSALTIVAGRHYRRLDSRTAEVWTCAARRPHAAGQAAGRRNTSRAEGERSSASARPRHNNETTRKTWKPLGGNQYTSPRSRTRTARAPAASQNAASPSPSHHAQRAR